MQQQWKALRESQQKASEAWMHLLFSSTDATAAAAASRPQPAQVFAAMCSLRGRWFSSGRQLPVVVPPLLYLFPCAAISVHLRMGCLFFCLYISCSCSLSGDVPLVSLPVCSSAAAICLYFLLCLSICSCCSCCSCHLQIAAAAAAIACSPAEQRSFFLDPFEAAGILRALFY